MACGLLLENWRVRSIMTKSDRRDLIAELEEAEAESAANTEKLAEEGADDDGDQNGYTAGLSYCIEMIKGRSGFYD